MAEDYERTFEEFWADIVMPDRVLSLDAVKRELHDYKMVMDGASEVYVILTGGAISKPNTDPQVVINLAREVMERDVREDLADEARNGGLPHE